MSPDTGLQLHEAIEKLSGHFDDSAELTCVRFACEIIFPLKVFLQTGDDIEGGLYVKTFSELLSFLPYDESMKIARDDFHVVVDDSDLNNNDEEIAGRVVADIFQQMIYLNLNIDVKKKSEIRKSLIKDRFRAKYQELRHEVEEKKKWLETVLCRGISDKGRERVQKIADALDKMLAAFDEGRKRPIRIAAMGTKKAGKSVIINGILKRDYAPTSSELPTPNIIKYIPEDAGTPLTLEYQEREQIFATPEDLNKYILNEFKEAQKHTGEGSGLADMIIHYPSEEFSGYEVWDTPGPNFAGAGKEHHEIAESCIRSADVCIFVENYSNHLTDDEVKFLQQIHTTFKSNNKFYSLFVAVNRIDERYSAEVEKSVSRLVDYLRSRLEELGYKNIVLFGTSALQSFYLDKVLELAAENSDAGEDLIDRINALKRTHKKFMTQLRFVESSLQNLKDFHNIANPTELDLRIFSGVPQLERYLKYIGEQKVDSEIVNNVITRCEGYFDTIKNANLISRMLELSEEDKKYLIELGHLLDGLNRDVDKVIDGVKHLVTDTNIDGPLLRIHKAAQSSRREVLGQIDGLCRDVVNTSTLNEDDIKQLRNGVSSANMKTINSNIAGAVAGLNRRSAETVEAMTKAESDKHSRTVEAGIQKAREEISRKTEEVREKVKNTTAYELMKEFSIPEFPPSLNKMSFTDKEFTAGVDEKFLRSEADRVHRTETHTEYKTETITKTRSVTRQRSSRGFWEGLWSFFGKKYYETKEEEYQEEIQKPYQVSSDIYDVTGFKRSIISELQRRVRRVVESAHDEIETGAEQITKGIYENIRKQCDEINAEYSGLFESFRNDINLASDETSQHKKSLENDIEVLREIDKSFEPFFTMWDEILNGQEKEQK